MQYKIIVDKQSRTNPSTEKREYIVDIEELHCKGDVYDSLVITKDEDYVMRRLELTEYHVLNVLDTPIKEPLNSLNIELFEGDNYIYLIDMVGNKFYAEYIVKNDFTDMYVTKAEFNSGITQTAKSIELSVNQKLTGYSTTEEMNAAIKLESDSITSTVGRQFENIDKSMTTMNSRITQTAESINSKVTKGNVCSEINQSAEEIYFKGNRIIIDSDKFKVTKNGKITATSGNIGGFELGIEKFEGNLDGIYNYNKFDLRAVMALVMGFINNNSIITNILDANSDGEIKSSDFLAINKILLGQQTNSKRVKGTFVIDSKDPKNCIKILKDSELAISLGTGGLNTVLVTTENLLCGNTNDNGYTGISVNGITGEMFFIKNNSKTTLINNDGISTPSLTQTSVASKKKNFEKLDNGINIIKSTDIYKYNLKSENDGTKKHIGFVIGDKYNYSKDITSNTNDEVDLYSMISVAYKAIQEQQEQIELLKEEIEKLKEAKNG